jgi:hypothetical protein
MEDNEFKLSKWINGHSLRQHREQIAAFKDDVAENCKGCQLKVANALLNLSDAVLSLFDGLDRRLFTTDMRERIDKAGKSLREQYELYTQELGQDMTVLESLGEDDPDVSGRIDEIRRGLDRLQETIRARVEVYEKKPISQKPKAINRK